VKWEYRVVTAQNALPESDLNRLGREGWEMVGLTSHVEDRMGPPGSGSIPVVVMVCVFKRPLATP